MERRLYASAMTLTGKTDHEDASYLDIAQAIAYFVEPAQLAADLEQLFRRIVFNVLTANRDDHLRNHGFLRTAAGWRLAPVFDVNPSLDKVEHTLALNAALRVPDIEIVRETAPLYRLSKEHAGTIIAEVRRAIASWSRLAQEVGVSKDEVERFAIAFDGDGVG